MGKFMAIIAVVGDTGSGKTTLLRNIALEFDLPYVAYAEPITKDGIPTSNNLLQILDALDGIKAGSGAVVDGGGFIILELCALKGKGVTFPGGLNTEFIQTIKELRMLTEEKEIVLFLGISSHLMPLDVEVIRGLTHGVIISMGKGFYKISSRQMDRQWKDVSLEGIFDNLISFAEVL